MKLRSLFGPNEYIALRGEDVEISSLMLNSNTPMKHALFFARKGRVFNGLDFADDAVKNGAVAIACTEEPAKPIAGIAYLIVEDIVSAQAKASLAFYEINSPVPKKIGVTGTNGKTTFVFMASEVFSKLGLPSAYTGTLGTNVPGFEGILTENTTFEPALYGNVLHASREAGYQYVFSEVSSQGIAMGRVDGIRFYRSVFMNLTEDHLDYHENMEEYYQAKKKLFGQF